MPVLMRGCVGGSVWLNYWSSVSVRLEQRLRGELIMFAGQRRERRKPERCLLSWHLLRFRRWLVCSSCVTDVDIVDLLLDRGECSCSGAKTLQGSVVSLPREDVGTLTADMPR